MPLSLSASLLMESAMAIPARVLRRLMSTSALAAAIFVAALPSAFGLKPSDRR